VSLRARYWDSTVAVADTGHQVRSKIPLAQQIVGEAGIPEKFGEILLPLTVDRSLSYRPVIR
jgi:hypothetical protein